MKDSLATLPRNELLARLRELVRKDDAIEAELLAHLGEVDARRLYLDEGCSSMFAYCVRVLHFAEAVAYKRIQAARAARSHPALLEAVRRGELHVTGVGLLAPHLSAENLLELLRAATHRSADEIRRLLADRSPRPDVSGSVRRIPDPARVAVPAARTPAPAAAHTPPVSAPTSPRPRAEPLGGERYVVRFTAGPELHAQLRELQGLMRHQIPDGAIAEILGRAVALLLEQVRKRKLGDCPAPRPADPAARPGNERPSRHVPAAIRRAVASRDGGRCTYVSASGRRCDARAFLEFHHSEAWARTREHPIEGITLRCRAHNQHAARQDFGERHMARFQKSRAARGSQEPARAQLDPDPVAPSVQLDPDPVGRERVVGPGRFELPTS